ncbi:hypothetical protein ACEPAH_1314 [Sanghuangporus vaninii]
MFQAYEFPLPSDTKQPSSAPAYKNAQLDIKYPEIFDRSTVYASGIGGLKEGDFRKPENRVRFRTIVENAGAFLQTLHSELNKPRKVNASLLDRFPDFRDGIEQTVPSLLAPTASESSNADVTPIELKCYVDIFRDIVHSVAKFESRSSDSSPLHTLFFGPRMIDPPFFSDEHRSLEKLEMIVDRMTRLRIFIETSDQSEIYTLTPKNDLAVIDRNYTLRLARILFNYRDEFLDVAGLPEPGRIQQIKKLVSDSKILPSFTVATTEQTESSDNSRQSSDQPTHVTTSETRTNPLLLSEKVKSLCPDGAYLQATEHEYVAAVKMTGIPPKTLGFVKLTNKHELDAFDAIRNSGSEFLLSRVVLPIKVVEIDECPVAFLPYGGEPLHKSWGLQDGPIGHETEIAWDLLTIISRLHELRITHQDIRPANVLWDPSTHSIRSEVETNEGLECDPFLADAFSCGQVLSNVMMAERMIEETRFVLEISRSLVKEDVNERWSISKAMQVWTDWLKEHGRPEYTR